MALLVLSSLLNAALGMGSLVVALFATHPDMSDVTMRVGYYVLHAIVVVAAVSVVAPWILAYWKHLKGAVIAAALPTILLGLAVLAFLLLDSWLQRTFGG